MTGKHVGVRSAAGLMEELEEKAKLIREVGEMVERSTTPSTRQTPILRLIVNMANSVTLGRDNI